MWTRETKMREKTLERSVSQQADIWKDNRTMQDINLSPDDSNLKTFKVRQVRAKRTCVALLV